MSLSYVEIELDRRRKIRYAIRDLRDLERMLQKPIGDVVADFNKLSVEALALFLWAGLRSEDKGLTPDKVLDVIDGFIRNGGEIADVRNAVSEALVLSGYFGNRAKQLAETDGARPPGPPA